MVQKLIKKRFKKWFKNSPPKKVHQSKGPVVQPYFILSHYLASIIIKINKFINRVVSINLTSIDTKILFINVFKFFIFLQHFLPLHFLNLFTQNWHLIFSNASWISELQFMILWHNVIFFLDPKTYRQISLTDVTDKL